MTLTYILEVDANGRIVGGEYYGDSLRVHPDFLWVSDALTESSIPYLDLGRVRELVRQSRGGRN